ncbi:MAG: SRPBCC domain-containing protein [Bacteroidota bacterium]
MTRHALPHAFYAAARLDAPIDLVFGAHADAHAFLRWWSPDPVHILSGAVDVGDTLHYRIGPAGQRASYVILDYTSMEHADHIQFRSAFANAQGSPVRSRTAPSWPRHVLQRFDFVRDGDEATVVTVRAEAADASADAQTAFRQARSAMEESVANAYRRLEAHLPPSASVDS